MNPVFVNAEEFDKIQMHHSFISVNESNGRTFVYCSYCTRIKSNFNRVNCSHCGAEFSNQSGSLVFAGKLQEKLIFIEIQPSLSYLSLIQGIWS